MVKNIILAVICFLMSGSCAMASDHAMQVGVQPFGGYVYERAIIHEQRENVYDILRRHPQEADRLQRLYIQIQNMQNVAPSGARYGHAVKVSSYLPFRVAGGYADDLGREYDEIVNRIGLNRYLSMRETF